MGFEIVFVEIFQPMKSLRLGIFAVLGLTSFHAFAQNENNWFDITSTNLYKWQGKSGSGTMTAVDGKKNAAYLYIYQRHDLKKDTVILRNLFVPTQDCQRGYGLAFHNLLSGEYEAKSNFVRNGPTVTDALGTVACNGLDELNGVTPATPRPDSWQQVTSNTDGNKIYSIQTSSVKKTTYQKKPAISILLREQNKKEDTSVYHEYIVSKNDCSKGFGKSYFLDFSGKQEFTGDFAKDGSSINSGLADAVCAL